MLARHRGYEIVATDILPEAVPLEPALRAVRRGSKGKAPVSCTPRCRTAAR